MTVTSKENPDSEALQEQPSTSMNTADATLAFTREQVSIFSVTDPDISPEEQDAIASLPSGSALLIVRRGPNFGARFLLDIDVSTVGRHPDAHVFLDDVTVSRRHAEFRRNGISFTVHDLLSLNGTYFEGERIEKDEELFDGSEVQIGKFRFTFYASRIDLVSKRGAHR